MKDQHAPHDTVAEPDAARHLDFSVHYLRRCRRENRGPAYVRVGRSIRYRIADLESWLASHRVETRDSRSDLHGRR